VRDWPWKVNDSDDCPAACGRAQLVVVVAVDVVGAGAVEVVEVAVRPIVVVGDALCETELEHPAAISNAHNPPTTVGKKLSARRSFLCPLLVAVMAAVSFA
jgi:hypothetical protein